LTKKTLCRRWKTCIMLAASVLLGQYSRAQSPNSSATPEPTAVQSPPSTSALKRMPDFRLKDTSGREFTLQQFRGKVLLVDFWATWCAPCRKEMPGYQELFRRYKDRGFEVVGIAADSDSAAVSRFGKKLGITYPLLVNGMDVQRYGVEGLPTTILVDRKGFIRKTVIGFEYTQVIESAARELLQDP
jgi:thiol-disulfide isomerase/thioredoxin